MRMILIRKAGMKISIHMKKGKKSILYEKERKEKEFMAGERL
jgi:hypothetical protein